MYPITLQVSVDLKLALPQVAVIGSQSSGKSSVLESLVSNSEFAAGQTKAKLKSCTKRSQYREIGWRNES